MVLIMGPVVEGPEQGLDQLAERSAKHKLGKPHYLAPEQIAYCKADSSVWLAVSMFYIP